MVDDGSWKTEVGFRSFVCCGVVIIPLPPAAADRFEGGHSYEGGFERGESIPLAPFAKGDFVGWRNTPLSPPQGGIFSAFKLKNYGNELYGGF